MPANAGFLTFSYRTNEYIPANAGFLIFSYRQNELPANAGFLIFSYQQNDYLSRCEYFTLNKKSFRTSNFCTILFFELPGVCPDLF